ncbi:ETX/MTX2 family pore-forming toxin [Dyadobacter sp. OTU695]|uniref:ETX/MTX2 family pore-forming toxin n=1 Tax=Dyadobacter sp. OTU695 TaxID=3043860 RepID=UPI00313C4F76
MSLKFLDKQTIGSIIVDAFQEQLNTEMDPANGQWFTNGPNNNGGLYGSLVDTLATSLVFLPNELVLTPHKLAADTAIIDNRNGLTPKSSITLSYSTTETTTTTHTVSNALKVGIGVDIKASAKFFGSGVDITTKISTDYTYSWSDAVSKTASETKQFSQTVPVEVPVGRVYQVVLTCDKTNMNAPYYADVTLTGVSTANFAGVVNGKNTWVIDAGTICDWINRSGSAGGESHMYLRDPQVPGQGLIRMRGSLTSSITANFVVNTYDITDTYNATGKAAVENDHLFADNELASLNHKLVSEKVIGQ